jgi:hypothetical protein
MRSDIVVVPSRHFAYVGADGRFRIEGAPEGKHKVVLWLPRRGERTAEVEVTANGTAAVVLGAD